MRIGFIGLGLMGAPMALNLARAGHRVRAWNRSPGKVEALTAEGVEAARDPADAATGAEALILMVSTGAVADAVLFEDPGAAGPALERGAAVVVMSSIPVDTAKAQAARLAALGVDYVDAPVSGGERGAIEGRLVIMAGGEAGVLERLQPLFAPMGRLTRIGPVGSGQLAKLANQVIVGVTIGAVAEALLLAERGGADPVKVREALLGGLARSTVLEAHGQRMIERRFEPGGHASTQLKDLTTARRQGESEGLELPLTRLTEALYAAMCETDRAALDHSALYLEIADRAAAEPPA